MEKFSSFERVVGNISEPEKERILRDGEKRFDDQIFEDLKGKEREKTPEELRVISLANEATNEIRQKYGLENLDIPPKNIHVITEEEWQRRESSAAVYISMLQGIAMREQPAMIVFFEKVFHEMLHFKSYNALQITTGENPKLNEYRVGLTAHTRGGEKMFFVNLNEAVTEEITKRFVTELFNKPLFTKEKKRTKEIVKRYSRAVATESGQPLFDNDTFYAEVEGKRTWGEAVGRFFGIQEKSKKITTERFTFQKERKILNTLIDKIFIKNPEKFQDRKEIFEIFARGMMVGNILPIGKLIDKTFGDGTLRRIGELDDDIQIQEKFIDSL